MDTNILNLYPKREKILTPEEFLSLTEKERENIEESKIIPPTLGEYSFGSFWVRFKRPIYESVVPV